MVDDFVPVERELWNNAKFYSFSHVAEPLIRCRKLIFICLFGVEEIGQEVGLPETIINQNKVNALKRLLEECRQLIEDNVHFLKKKDKKDLEKLSNQIEEIDQVIDGVSYITSDQRTGIKELKLVDEHYNLCLNELRRVCSKLKGNLADLIFPAGDDYDLERIKQDIIEGG